MKNQADITEDDRAAIDKGVLDYCAAMASMGLVFSTLLQGAATLRRGIELPEGYEAGEARQCYANSGRLVLLNDSLRYCEGYALQPGSIPVHHAWCLTQAGHVVDVTWKRPENCSYLGLVFDRTFACSVWQATGIWDLWSEVPAERLMTCTLREMVDAQWLPATADPTLLDLHLKEIAEISRKKSRTWVRDMNEQEKPPSKSQAGSRTNSSTATR